jgi:hypothetical protein
LREFKEEPLLRSSAGCSVLAFGAGFRRILPKPDLPALSTSNFAPASCRKSPSAIWLRAELPVQRISTLFLAIVHPVPSKLKPTNNFSNFLFSVSLAHVAKGGDGA